MIATLMSPNVHSPSELLLWIALTLQTFVMALVVTKVVSLARRRVGTQSR